MGHWYYSRECESTSFAGWRSLHCHCRHKLKRFISVPVNVPSEIWRHQLDIGRPPRFCGLNLIGFSLSRCGKILSSLHGWRLSAPPWARWPSGAGPFLYLQSHLVFASSFRRLKADPMFLSNCSSLKGLSRNATAPACIACSIYLDFSDAEVETGCSLIAHIFLDERSYRNIGKSVVRTAVENTFCEKTMRTTSANA